MKKYYNVTGMNCNHCRSSVEKALNSIDGVSAAVSLDPAVAEVEFSGEEIPLSELNRAVSEAGEFILSAKEA